jgi:hypothetical protein
MWKIKKMNFEKWGKFMLGDVFDMSNTKSITQKSIVFNSGDIPYVTASAENNGVLTYISCPIEWLDRGNCIVIGGKTLTFTYQKNDFCSNDSHNLALYIKENDQATEMHFLFLMTALKASLKQRYSWSNSISMKTIKNDYFFLPVDANGKPNWAYIDLYMKKIIKQSSDDIKCFNLINRKKLSLDIIEWKRFHLYDDGLFDIDMGTKLDKSKMTDLNPSINFVGRSNNNNGITARVDELNGLTPYPKGYMTLSLGGEYLGSCFIQSDRFYVSQNVIVLKPKWEMSMNIKLFISSMIFCESRTYYKAFINELNRHVRKDFSFFLPVTSEGTPNWEYMDEYMSNIMVVSERKIDSYNQLLVNNKI